jgi:uncharacterized membrane protein
VPQLPAAAAPFASSRNRVAVVRRLFGPTFIFAGVMHFVIPRAYESIVPDYLPARRAVVYAS